MKSDIEIKDDVFAHIMESGLMGHLTGSLEKNGKRPQGSTQEDVVISVEGVDETRSVQRAYVAVNIYVRDTPRSEGDYVENSQRIREICNLAKDALAVGGIGKDFTFHLEKQRVVAEENTREHRIWNRLYYQVTTD